jgi:hypothetical protein
MRSSAGGAIIWSSLCYHAALAFINKQSKVAFALIDNTNLLFLESCRSVSRVSHVTDQGAAPRRGAAERHKHKLEARRTGQRDARHSVSRLVKLVKGH